MFGLTESAAYVDTCSASYVWTSTREFVSVLMSVVVVASALRNVVAWLVARYLGCERAGGEGKGERRLERGGAWARAEWEEQQKHELVGLTSPS
jgi:hypothetical protein